MSNSTNRIYVQPSSLDEVLDVLSKVDYLHCADELLIEVPNRGSLEKEQVFVLSLSSLAAVDERLPYAIHALKTHTANFINERIDSPIFNSIMPRSEDEGIDSLVLTNLLYYTIKTWEEKEVVKTLEEGILPYRLTPNFGNVCLEEKNVNIEVSMVYGELTMHGYTSGRVFPVVAGYKTGMFHVCPLWLNEKHPNWQKRYEIALTLGYEGNELFEYAISTGDKPSVQAIQDLSFE